MTAPTLVGPVGGFRKDYDERLMCPRCRVELLPLGYPGALSRTDNKTEVCSACGTAEAMEDWLDGGCRPQSSWPV